MKDMYINDQISLAEGKFANNKDIDKIVFSPNVSYIPENCFNGCDNLKEITFEGNIIDIEAAAFINCKNLKTISANNINIIKDFAFHGCNNVIDFNIKEDIAKNIKYGINNDILSTYFILPEIGTPLNDISWLDIHKISKQDKAKKYFNIGDEKKLQIDSETYHVQILDFDHDDKSDGTGKAGITVGLKEIMTTRKTMNSTDTNVGGWKDSEMRTYLQIDVYNALPDDVKTVIKTVDKILDIGNQEYTLNTTQDKLFLLSFEEVGFTSADVPIFVAGFVAGQGTKYEFFSDNDSRIKKRLNGSGDGWGWWLRSAYASGVHYFFNICNDGSYGIAYADNPFSVAPAFCI